MGRSLLLALLAGCAGLGYAADAPSFSLSAPAPGQALKIHLEGAADATWAVLFYRLEGEEGFQALTLEVTGNTATGSLPPFEGGGHLECFLVLRGIREPLFLPAGAPQALERVELPAAGPRKVEPPFTQSFPFQVEGSLEDVLSRSNPLPGERTHLATGQAKVGYQAETGEQKFSLEARMSYQDSAPPGSSRWSLAELRSRYGYRNHALQAGDLLVQESEFSIGGAGRRGLDYTYRGETLYGHAFAVNSERLPGFQGMVWPAEGTRVFGGALGYGWFEGRLKSKLILVSGRDDPSAAIGIGFLPFNRIREGTTAAWTLEANLPAQGLNLSGEWARSRFDADVNQAPQPVNDGAWRLGGNWQAHGFNLRGNYRAVGRDFGSVGLPILAVDRQAFDGGFGFSQGAWSFNFNAQDERHNPDQNPLETRSRNDTRSVDLRYAFLPSASLRIGASQSEQESLGAVNALIPFASSHRNGGFAGLDWTFAPLGVFSLNAQLERLRSLGAMASAGRSETYTAALNLTWPELLRLAPTLSLSRTLDEVTGQATRNLSAFLASTLTFAPGLASLALNAGHSRLGLLDGSTQETTSADGALQFQFDRLLAKSFGRGACLLALRGRYLRRQDLPSSDRRVSLTLNFAF